MSQYSDVPAINVLYQENETVNNAITMIDSGGNLSNFTISPPPPGEMGVPMMMAALITTGSTEPDSALMADLRAWLVNRSNAILAELASMGVTEPPPSGAGVPPVRSTNQPTTL